MKYIFMAAGKGTRLNPLTLSYPKAMYLLDENTTVLERMVNLIKKYDDKADIVVVTGHMHHVIEKSVKDVTFVHNPFYNVTNSVASLWFAQKHIETDPLVILNGDVVISEKLAQEKLCIPIDRPTVFVDSSVKNDGDYNVEIFGDEVLVMGKGLKQYYGEYAGITKLDGKTAKIMKAEMNAMIDSGYYDQWFENVLVQMIFEKNFHLYYDDVMDYKWTELDSVDDLLAAKSLHAMEM